MHCITEAIYGFDGCGDEYYMRFSFRVRISRCISTMLLTQYGKATYFSKFFHILICLEIHKLLIGHDFLLVFPWDSDSIWMWQGLVVGCDFSRSICRMSSTFMMKVDGLDESSLDNVSEYANFLSLDWIFKQSFVLSSRPNRSTRQKGRVKGGKNRKKYIISYKLLPK